MKMDMQYFTVAWFDVVAFLVLVVGLFHGKHRGMSNELLDVFKWLLAVVISALYYEWPGDLIVKFLKLSRFHAYLLSYCGIAFVIHSVFGVIKAKVGKTLVGSDIFGRWEFYLGMFAGMTRYACMLMMGMALLNARYVSPAVVDAEIKKQEAIFGAEFFMTYGRFQLDVLYKSVVGQFVREKLSGQLIEPVVYVPPTPGAGASGGASKKEKAWKGESLEDRMKKSEKR